jgi:hypothetical protein
MGMKQISRGIMAITIGGLPVVWILCYLRTDYLARISPDRKQIRDLIRAEILAAPSM